MTMMRGLLLAVCLLQHVIAFAPRNLVSDRSMNAKKFTAKNDDDESRGIPNPFRELGDMFSNFDDVIDDFFYKRMGNGEVFYGKRKFKPSGKVEGSYNGMGLTDKLKIDMSRERKEIFLEEKRRREEEENRK